MTTITISDEYGLDYGASTRIKFGDYYTINPRIHSETQLTKEDMIYADLNPEYFTVNYYGKEYDKCLYYVNQTISDWKTKEVTEEGEVIDVDPFEELKPSEVPTAKVITYEWYFRVPESYDGLTQIFYHTTVAYDGGNDYLYSADRDPAKVHLFRLPAAIVK